ncbi:MAG: toll/interleukin-1 receptor domain-containing protein, partial [Anaerolineae bacterium]|nr:toll/interleukin-1 receptor domain-containing protein [Anaerolineae bacterium]
MSHVFISYARKDGREHADRLAAALSAAGYPPWLDRRGIDPAKDFTGEIESAIRTASHVVVCVTPDTERADSFVRREVQHALMLDKPIYVAKVVAGALPPIHINTHTYFPFCDDWEASFAGLREHLARPAASYRPPAPAAPAHPLRPYVQRLYESANNHLETAIIKLIDLEIAETPDAVPAQKLDMIEMLFGDARGEHEFTSFDAAFKHFNRRALLLGEPGAGKTVTLMATARQAAADWLSDPSAHPLPVLGIIATWDAGKQQPLTDWLGAQKGLTPDALGGRTLLLLDGLDELGGERTEKRKDEHTGKEIEERYDPRQRFISALNAQLGENRALVTCRIADYEAIGQQVTLDGAVTLQRLTDAQMRIYLADLPDLQAAIDADEGLREMARTPLLLSYLAFGFRDRPDAVKELHDLREGALRDAIFNAYMD